MATHRRKVVDVEARKYEGPATLNVVHHVKGQQTAKKGDWLVGSEAGQIEVITDKDFQRDYEPIGDESDVERVKSIGTNDPNAPVPPEVPLHDPTSEVVGGETQDGVPVAHLGNAEESVTDEPVIDDTYTPVAPDPQE